ncbi:MAG TPA: DUF4149 domain-containing protein [Terriglobales bacterium]|jgi:uncharacterized membrane protein|nr:DUF4149 domain-containing protein [Terriglobales bacterium]
MSFLRYLMLLSLVVWLGGLIFFSFVLAPTVFAVLPTRHLAGNVVSRSLTALHWMGIVSGLIFLVCSMIYARLTAGSLHPFAGRHVLLYLMLALTLISQFGISPKMAALRASMGEIDSVALTDPARVQFDALHVWSTRLEGSVFFLGLALVYVTAQALKT